MKKLIALSLVLLMVGTAWAIQQTANSDAGQRVHVVSAYDVTTIAADTAIGDWANRTIMAITPETDVNVYFGTDTTNDFEVLAGTLFAINPGYDVKLKTATVCLVF